jgi:2-amino-4-hydroxy-6-hydroxymethyldihydropteridine diphosphokinase
MTIAFLGLGSNLESPLKQLTNAIESIKAIPSTTLLQTSSFYKNSPVGPQDQPDFLNAVVSIDTELRPYKLLDYLQEIETRQGRTRDIRWGARTLDLDILLFGDEIINTKRLVIPHREMHKRGFVIQPLYEIAPDLEIPGQGLLKDLIRYINTSDMYKISCS